MSFFDRLKSQLSAEDTGSAKQPAEMTLEELALEEKKMKSQKLLTAVVIGGLIGIAVWSATHKGFILPVILLLFAYRIAYKYSQNLKSIQAEISRKGTID